MISIFQNIAPVLALVLILSGAVVGADIGNVWQAPAFIRDIAYFVVALTIAVGAVCGGIAIAASRR
jgi:hypothetical protein